MHRFSFSREPLASAGLRRSAVLAAQTELVAVAQRHGARWIRLPERMGIGSAMRAGLRYAARFGCDAVVRIDGDGQHCGVDIPRVLAPVLNGRADVVLGSRYAASTPTRRGLAGLLQQSLGACLSLAGRLLVFPLAELKLQSKGGRGLTLIDVDASDALVSVAAFSQSLLVIGTGRGGRAKEETLKNSALAAYVGKRARKGKSLAGMKGQRVVAA